MPSPEKDRPSGRRLGRLLAALRPSRAGPLPVQTGFPTSLADLVVKNHGRLKKQPSPNSKRKKSGVSSASPAPSPPSSTQPPPSPPPPAAAVSLPRPDLSPAQPVRREKSGAFGLGLGFLAFGGVVSLALLVIWSKKVVAAVTVAAFSLFLLESLRCSAALPRRRPRTAATEMQLYLDGRGRVSPIREVEAETEPSRRLSCSDSGSGIEASVLLAAEERSGSVLDESSDSKGKAKKRSWKKLIASAKKLHKGRKINKDAGDFSGSFRSEGGRSDAAVSSNLKAEDVSGSRRGTASETDAMSDAAIADEPDSLGSRRRRSTGILGADDVRADLTMEEPVAEEQTQRRAGIRFPALVLVAVVLVGLVAGKLPAVAFTMLSAAFFSSAPRFPCRGEWRRLELPASGTG